MTRREAVRCHFRLICIAPRINITGLSETLGVDRGILRPELDRLVEEGVTKRDSRRRYMVNPPLRDRIVNVVTASPNGISLTNMSEELGVDKEMLRAEIDNLRREGVIRIYRGRYYPIEG